MSQIRRGMPVEELAAIVSQALRDSRTTAVLSGGAVVTIYSENQYESADLDFVSSAPIDALATVMKSLGFERTTGRHFEHFDCDYSIEFPPGPLMVGNLHLRSWETKEFGLLKIEMLTPTQCVMDRLAAFFHWNDKQCFDQAVMVASRQGRRIDLAEIERWANNEGHPDRFVEFKKRLKQARKSK